MTTPLMPIATAVWLIDNTALTFTQIAEFCNLHIVEVEGIADGTVATSVKGVSPITAGMLDASQIKNAEANPKGRLMIDSEVDAYISSQSKAAKYTPIARRQDKPNAVAWLVYNYANISDVQVSKLIGTTKKTIQAIRNKEHRSQSKIVAKDPVLLGLCTQIELSKVTDILDREIAQQKADMQ